MGRPRQFSKTLWGGAIYNALAFLSKGNFALAYALAQQVRTSRDVDIATEAVRLIDHLRSAGVPPASLKNPWRRTPLKVLAHLAILAVVPGIIGLAIYSDESGVSRQRGQQQSQATLRPTDDPFRPRVPMSGAALDDSTLPTCWRALVNGETLRKRTVWSDDGHSIEVKNGVDANAIVKVRHATTGALLVSFYVAKGNTAAINVPDGLYRVQYALGGNLGADCESFVRVMSASQFPDIENLSTEYIARGIVKKRLSYTLYPIAHGNVVPRAIDLAAFNAE